MHAVNYSTLIKLWWAGMWRTELQAPDQRPVYLCHSLIGWTFCPPETSLKAHLCRSSNVMAKILEIWLYQQSNVRVKILEIWLFKQSYVRAQILEIWLTHVDLNASSPPPALSLTIHLTSCDTQHDRICCSPWSNVVQVGKLIICKLLLGCICLQNICLV